MVRQGLKYINSRSPLTKGMGPRALWKFEFAREMYERRIRVGPDPYKPRRELPNFNYESELEVMKRRFHQPELDLGLLKQALTDVSFNRDGFDDQSAVMDNSELAEEGRKIARRRLGQLYRYWYRKLPREAIIAICDDHMCDRTAGELAKRLGFVSLARSTSSKAPSDQILAQCLFAFAGAIARASGQQRAQAFVSSVFPHNRQTDLSEIWPPKNAPNLAEILDGLLGDHGPAEPRMLWKSAINTPYACYVIGQYAQKELIGWSAGMSEDEAIEMSARDAIRRFVGIVDNHANMPIRGLDKLDLSDYKVDD